MTKRIKDIKIRIIKNMKMQLEILNMLFFSRQNNIIEKNAIKLLSELNKEYQDMIQSIIKGS